MLKLSITMLLLAMAVNICCDSELSDLDCGKIESEFYYYMDIFSGGAGGFNTSGKFRENPALIASEGINELQADFSAGLGVGIGTLYPNYQNKINSELDEMTAGVQSDSLETGYPDVEFLLRQAGGVRQLTYQTALGSHGYWGISLWRPLAMGGEIIGNTISVTLKTDAGVGEDEETKVVLGNDFGVAASIELTQTRLGYVYKLDNGINLGAGIDLLNLEIAGDGYSKTEGFIRQYGGDTDISQAFNDPVDSQYFQNTLDNEWEVNYEELLAGFNGGLTYQIGEYSLIDIGLSQPYQQELSGESVGIVHSLGAVDYEALTGDGEGELFDELLLEPSKMTYSNETIYRCRSLVLNYPGLIRLGWGMDKERSRHQFCLCTYTGELSLRYKGEVVETGREKTGSEFSEFERVREVDYTYGIKLKSKLEYNFSHQLSRRVGYWLSLQYYSLEEVTENIRSASGESAESGKLINLMTGNIGLSWQICRNLQADCTLIGFPGPILKTSISWKLGGGK